MSDYAYLVPASHNYEPGLQAMFCSLMEIENKQDVILLSYNLSKDFLAWSATLPFMVMVIPGFIEGMSQTEATAIERFKHAVVAMDNYKSICLLDADMYFLADPETFFKVAAAGFIVSGSNGMIINFGRNYQEYYGVELDKPDWPYTKIHTSVPIFISKKHAFWFDQLYNSRRIDHWDDFLYLNLLGIKLGVDKDMIVMPPYMFTGIHHWQMKPETAIMHKGGNLYLSGTEEQVYMVHGKWWDQGWLQDLAPTMLKYHNDEMMGDKGRNRTENAIRLLKETFEYLYTLKEVRNGSSAGG